MAAVSNDANTVECKKQEGKVDNSVEGPSVAQHAERCAKRPANRPIHHHEKRPAKRRIRDGQRSRNGDERLRAQPDQRPHRLADDGLPVWPAERPDDRPEEIQANIAYNNHNDIFIHTTSYERILDCVVNICAVFQQMADDSMRQAYPSPPPTPPSTPPPRVLRPDSKKKH